MTRTQYYTATSLDGFLADEHGSLDWLFEVERDAGGAGEGDFPAFLDQVGAFVMGATTYLWTLREERLLDHPEKWQGWYGDRPCWVFTHRELPAVPGADVRFAQGDVRPVHAEMTAAAGGRNVWVVGGGALAGDLAEAGLLDELIVTVAPVTLGAGAPLLPRRLTSGRLTLREARQVGPFARLVYAVRR